MSDLTIKFKGNPIVELSESGTKTLKTAGKYCEGDITVEYSKPAGGGGGATESIISFVTDTAKNNKMTSANVDAEIVPFSIFKDTQLSSVELSNKVKIIGYNAFSYCYNLVLQAFPSSLQVIDGGAFTKCEKITISHIPSGVKTISNYAFSYCNGLTNITFDGKPDTISASAFNSCTNLTTINVPWAEEAVANAPWGATNATINYNYTGA